MPSCEDVLRSLGDFSISAANARPVGYLDVATTSEISGWAYDTDAGTNPIEVRIYADYKLVKTLIADNSRPDIVAHSSKPDPNHGYSWKNPNVRDGAYIQAMAIDYPSGDEASIGDNAIGWQTQQKEKPFANLQFVSKQRKGPPRALYYLIIAVLSLITFTVLVFRYSIPYLKKKGFAGKKK
ncbi:MAG: hypothetical protein HYT16_01795 [DPANN group archaeon]|nr:hypothetical protein [DPANN group archaeon]